MGARFRADGEFSHVWVDVVCEIRIAVGQRCRGLRLCELRHDCGAVVSAAGNKN